jgi:hypothetical protein
LNRPALLSVLAFATVPGCTLVDVEVRVPEVCLSYDELEVEGVPLPEGIDGTHTIQRSFAIDDLSSFHEITDHDADVAFVRGEILALSGISDFSFIDAARIVISSGDEGSTLPPLVLFECDGDCVAAGGALDMTPDARRDAVEYLRGNSLVIDIEMTGRPPADAWSMRVDVCFQASARYQYEYEN